MSDLAKPGPSINVTNLFHTLTGRAERQQSLEQRKRLELGWSGDLTDDDHDVHGDDPDLYPESAFDEFGRVNFIETAREADAVYDSKEHAPGIGYPSCSRALSRMVKSRKDPNGYYRFLGVEPSVSFRVIRAAIRKLYQKFHPDGSAPNTREFDYLREIAHVLTDPKCRLRYDNLAEGEKWLDSRVRESLGMIDDAIVVDHLKGPDADESAWSTMRRTEGEQPETVREQEQRARVSPQNISANRDEAMRQVSEGNGYDFFAEPFTPGDFQLAQIWYFRLVRMAPLGGFTRPMRVWLNNEAEPYWSDIGGILKIPRFWWPSDATAYALFKVTIGDTRFQSAADVGPMR